MLRISRANLIESTNLKLICRFKSDVSYQYLEKSPLPTYKFQRSLPRLSIPDLNKTCHRYLEALKPIIASQQQYEQTKSIVNEFAKGEGVRLHEELVRFDKLNKHTSYISEPWFDMYLKSRVPLPLNYNPFMAWKLDSKPEYNTQLLRTTNMLISALRFKRSLEEQKLKPEVFHLNPKNSDTQTYQTVMKISPSAIATYVSFAFKAFPLDMSQFQNLFCSTRIPKLIRDEILVYPKSKHIVILRNGQFFVFDVVNSNGDIKEPSELLTCIKYILEQPKIDKESIAVLSTEERDTWAKTREILINSNAVNKENIQLIDSAHFVICLDDFVPQNLDDGAHNYLHGCNKNNKFINRWFDKSFSVILTKDANAAVNFEHSWGDGVAVLRFFNDVFTDSTTNHHVNPDTPISKTIDPSKQVKRLDFSLNDSVKKSIEKAKSNLIMNTKDLELSAVLYEKMNRDYFKRKKLSPDSMFQLGFQMAYYRLYNSPAATYESCSTAAFKHGRTETVRSATTETQIASLAFLSKQKRNQSELRALLDNCSKKHFQLTKEAAMGQGFDRHLFAMRNIAEKKGEKLPSIYTDQSYIQANHFILSTSTLYGEAFQGGGFAPVVKDGFGCGYGYVDNILGVLVSSYNPHRNGQQFGDAFRASLDDIYEVLEKVD